MTKLLSFLFLSLGMSSMYADCGSCNPSSPVPYSQYRQQDQQMPAPQNGPSSDCSHLSQQEQQFASQLSTMHRTMFCRHFSVSQRIEAMTLADTTNQQGSVSPDEAVEVVMKNARESQGSQQMEQPQQQPQQSPYDGGYRYPSRRSPYSGS